MEAENLTVEDSTPETVALWRCIGCGAMGNASECVGSCDFKRLFVIAAARYADLLDYCLNLDERNEALRVLARDLHAETGEDERFARALASLRQRAKALLALGPVAAPPPAACEEEADEIWRCARCGQIEAFRDCLGVCIRRTAEFVLSSDYEAVAARVARFYAEQCALTALARQVAWSSPKPGQTSATRLAFRRHVMGFAPR